MAQDSDSFFLFSGEGEVKALLRTLDWSGSPLGHPSTWPRELAVAVDMVLHSAFPMFVAWGPALGFLYNDAYARIMGAKHPAALGQRFESIWSEIWPDILPIIDRALSNQSSYHEDLPLTVVRRGYPEPSYFTFAYSPLHDGAGQVGGMYCTVIETTARVQSERRAAFELAVSDALRPLTSPTDILERASALLGEQLAVDRVVYAEVDDERGSFFVPCDWGTERLPSAAGKSFSFAGFGTGMPALSRAGQVLAVDDTGSDPRAADADGLSTAPCVRAVLSVPLVKAGRLTAFLALHSATPRRWTDDEILLVRSMAERTWAALETARAQGELREERDRSQYIFDTIAEGFLLLDRDFNVLQLNAEGERVAGIPAQQVLGRCHWELWPESADTEGGQMYQRVMRTRQAGAAEYCHVRPGGERVWLDLRAYPTREGGVASFFRDITDRKLAEEKLVAADRRKDEFLAMLAHELRNPLAPISAAADLLKIGRLDEARVRQSSAIIARQVRHMISLVDDLLDVSRVTRGLVTLAKAPVSARTIVDEAVEQVLPLVRARGQQLAVRVEDGTATVLGDRARLVQVMANLLNNAAKYTPEGCAIEALAAAEGDSLVLTVRDEGIGMDAELTGRVFELFAQGQRSADRSQGGLGLGLALVKHLVELHGGCVSCASPGPGQGSTFEIRLPVMRTGEADGQAPVGAGPAPGARLKLMIVDDNVDAAETLGLLLEACGHEVAVEHQPLRALARARDLCPDVCLLDIGLPEIDGNELARRLLAQPETADAVLVAVTGYGQERDREQAFLAGFRHHLVKPVDMDKLAGVLAEIGGRSARGVPA
jgi:PAS domain S-box-containing protein